MGCFWSKKSSAETPFDFKPGDLAFLLIGCAGTKTNEFANAVMKEGTSSIQKSNICLLRNTNVPGSRKPVVFIVPPETSKQHAKDDQIISQVQRSLQESRPRDPYVDHILLFPEDPLGIQPANPASYVRDFAKLCCRTSAEDVHAKISLVLENELGATVQGDAVYEYWVEKNVKRYHFKNTEESARHILQRVAPAGAL